MSDLVSIQWFPGHMAKTRRLMRESVRLVDLVVELTDARIPQSSRNPELSAIVGKKARIVLLNKADSADPEATARWCSYYKALGIPALATDCRTGKGLGGFLPLVKETLADKMAQWEKKGMGGRPIRMMIVGIPNVGKSSLINRLSGRRSAKVEDRPGVTRGKQWVTLDSGLELLDMPGVLWPKFEDKQVGEYLAFTGAVKDDILDVETLAARLAQVLAQRYPRLLQERYKLTEEMLALEEGYDLLEAIGRKRGMLVSGGEVNLERAAVMLLDEFRGGKIGRITLEAPPREPGREAPAQ